MDLPTDIVDAVANPAPDALPARATRTGQRRRAAGGNPGADVAGPPMIRAASSDLRPIEPPPPSPVSFDPPATVMADTMIEDRTMDMIDTAATTSDTAEPLTGQGNAAFADLNVHAKEAMEKTARMAEELSHFAKSNLEAMVESSKIAAKGIETLGQSAAEFSRKQFESTSAAMKTLAATRSPTEFLKLQSDYARAMVDTMVAETSKSTELLMKLASDVAQPLSNRVAIARDKMKTGD